MKIGSQSSRGVIAKLGFRFGERHIESQIVVCRFISGPADDGRFFALNLLPTACAFSAEQAKIIKVRLRGEFQGRKTFLFQDHSSNSASSHAFRHELEPVGIFDKFRQGPRIFLGSYSQEIIAGPEEMFIGQSRLQNAIDSDKRHLQEAGCDAASQQFADLGGQLTETWIGVVVLVGSGIIEIAIGMKRGQFSQDFPQFQINIEGSKVGCFDQRLQSGAETIQAFASASLVQTGYLAWCRC